MKTLVFKLIPISTVILLSFCSLCGCKRITSQDIAGAYVRVGSGVTDSLMLNTNGSFQENVTFTNGGKWSVSGQWKFDYQIIELDKCYAAFDFEHKTIIIPPELVVMQRLWVEKNKLIKNTYEPIWMRQSGKIIEPQAPTNATGAQMKNDGE